MAGCCDPHAYDEVFRSGFARRVAKKYQRRGLDGAATRMVDFLAADGLAGATVLEIGGGVGEIGLELLSRGAESVVELELSTAYDPDAARLAGEAGVADRVHRRIADIATTPHDVGPADIVVLHRVVCCYPDHERLLTAVADHCRARLAFSHPPRNLGSRSMLAMENAFHAVRGQEFRAFAHPPERMLAVLTARGLQPALSDKAGVWRVQGLTRLAR